MLRRHSAAGRNHLTDSETLSPACHVSSSYSGLHSAVRGLLRVLSCLHLFHPILPPQLAGSTLLDVVTHHDQEGTGIQGDSPEERQEVKGTWRFEFVILIISQDRLVT